MFVRRCRYCKSYEIYPAKRESALEFLLYPLLLLRPYRCNRCLKRQVGFRLIRPAIQLTQQQEQEQAAQSSDD